MKKSLLVLLLVFLTVAVFANGQQEGAYADGVYFAQEGQFSEKSGWQYVIVLEVEGGNIVDVNWTGAHMTGGTDKKTRSIDGEYNMVAYGEAQSEWDVQAALVEAALLDSQDVTAGADAITGVSIGGGVMFELAAKAIAAGPVGYGPYTDGAFHVEEADFSENSGWKSTADFTVIGGRIIAAYWNGVHKDGGETKKEASINGNYNMVAYGDAQSEWDVQAALTEAALLDSQDLGTDVDAITGVSIGAGAFFGLAKEALMMR